MTIKPIKPTLKRKAASRSSEEDRQHNANIRGLNGIAVIEELFGGDVGTHKKGERPDWVDIAANLLEQIEDDERKVDELTRKAHDIMLEREGKKNYILRIEQVVKWFGTSDQQQLLAEIKHRTQSRHD